MHQRLRNWWTRKAGGREVLRLALPLVVSALSWTVMHFTDRMFLLWHSQEAMAAALPAHVVWWLVVCFPLGICTYVNTFVAQYHGARRPARIGTAVWQGVWVAVAGTPIVLATIPLAPMLFQWAGHPTEVIGLEVVYYQVLCWGAGFMLAGEAMACFFTGRGLTLTVMTVNAIAAAVNVVLDYFWIFGYAGFPALGIEGAAWATVVGQAVKVALFLALMALPAARREYGTWSGCRLDLEVLSRLIRFGAPAGLQLTVEVLGISLFIVYVGRLGEMELAATNLAFNVSSLAFMPVHGLSIAVTTLVGQRLGEDRDDLAARATWTTCLLAVGYMAFMSLFYLTVPDLFLMGHLAGAHASTSDELRDTAVVLLRFVAAYNLFDALLMVFLGAIKGAGDTRFVLYASTIMAFLLAVGTWIVVEVYHLGLYACWVFIALWVCAAGIVYMARFLRGHWRKMRVIEKSNEAAPVLMGALEGSGDL